MHARLVCMTHTSDQNQPDQPGQPDQPQSFYEAVGGQDTFRRIVHEFYLQVPEDDILGPMYPADDLAGAEDRLFWFLSQYWGGPSTYQAHRGHPRLRMRHHQFVITEDGAKRWLELMGRAVATIPEETLDAAHRAALWDHMERVAAMLVNHPG